MPEQVTWLNTSPFQHMSTKLYQFLFFGWGCLVFQPLALQYGKRPVYLISILATMVRNLFASGD